ncbi:MAG: hypothetical protein BWX77_00916 [Bacteroidetes bacterium ADurb.Bin090]|nr:MAG: hypothetical protein BWX77_00916 [Bacteroidetes bacterium ADurb.Bin090]
MLLRSKSAFDQREMLFFHLGQIVQVVTVSFGRSSGCFNQEIGHSGYGGYYYYYRLFGLFLYNTLQLKQRLDGTHRGSPEFNNFHFALY